MRDDGPLMMQAGWALWDLGGLHANQCGDFIADGFRIWRSGGVDDAVQRAFLEDCLERLGSEEPPAPADVWTAPREQVAPAQAVQSLRCYMASELVELVARARDPEAAASTEERAYRLISGCREEFVPPRSKQFVFAYSADHGLPIPWS